MLPIHASDRIYLEMLRELYERGREEGRGYVSVLEISNEAERRGVTDRHSDTESVLDLLRTLGYADEIEDGFWIITGPGIEASYHQS